MPLLSAIFAIAALSLAAIGLYAVMAGFVRQRNHEIGIRIALGATAADIRRLVVGEGLLLAGAGVIIGLAGAVGSTRVLRALLFAVHPLDAQVMLGAVLLLVGVATAACYVPARRAARVDPIAMLRMD